MPRPAKGPRLHRYKHTPYWYIADTGRTPKSTGCASRPDAEKALADYIAEGGRGERCDLLDKDGVPAAARKIVRKAKERARIKGREFALDIESVSAQLIAQEMKCAVSGMAFSLEKSTDGRRHPFYPSPDRINNDGGYTPDNVRYVCSIVNLARGDFSDGEFRLMCKAVAQNS